MNVAVSLPMISATPTIAPAMPVPTDRRALEAYASWLFMERRLLCLELYPHLGDKAEEFDWADNAGFHWHFRPGAHWEDRPQPSSRAASILDSVGVDWRSWRQDLGLNHADTGNRPDLPAKWPTIDGDLEAASDNVCVCELAFGSIDDDEEALHAVAESEGVSIDLLSSQPSLSIRGLAAKAQALIAINDPMDYAFESIAKSLAEDIIRISHGKDARTPSVHAS